MTTTTPTAQDISSTLRRHFGFETLRPLQDRVIGSILDSRDTFVLMPTGAGKSLCYQLPALLLPGVTVVVSPLIALMKDQVDKLVASGISATFVNSSLDFAEARRRQAAVLAGEVKIVYVAPERLMMPAFLALLSQIDVSLFAIDEAHCISEWGHDFRPEYRELSDLRRRFPKVPIAGFTATATKRVEADILKQLGLVEPVSVRGSLDRHNISYRVLPKKDSYRSLLEYVRTKRGQSGIVYVGARNTADTVADRLNTDGISAIAYHAGLDAPDRARRQDRFLSGDVNVVVATIAFGMGIDKPDIRFVVHLDLPKNLEGFYQESGRAGRDGEPADSVLFYSYYDVSKLEYFIKDKSRAEQVIAREQIARIVSWAKSTTCRREALLTYFDETLESRPDVCCDVCNTPKRAMADYTTEAQMVLSCAKRTGEQFGAVYLVRVLMGSEDKRVLANGHNKVSTYGIGADRQRNEWSHVASELTEAGYLEADPNRGNGLRVTPIGDEVLFKGRKVSLPEWRPDKAAAGGPRPKPPAGGTVAASVRMLQEGKALTAIAQERGLSPVTIESHIAAGIEAGDVDVANLVPRDRREVIERMFERLGGRALKPVKEELGDDYSYGEIKFVRAAMDAEGRP